MESATNQESIIDIEENHKTNSVNTLWNFIAPKISVARNILYSAITDLLDKSKVEEYNREVESYISLHRKNTKKSVWTLSTTAGRQGSLCNINLDSSVLKVLDDTTSNTDGRNKCSDNFQMKCHSNKKFDETLPEEDNVPYLRPSGEEETSDIAKFLVLKMEKRTEFSSIGVFNENRISTKKSNYPVQRKKNLVIKCNYILQPASKNILEVYRHDSSPQAPFSKRSPTTIDKEFRNSDKTKKNGKEKCASKGSTPPDAKYKTIKERLLNSQAKKIRSEKSYKCSIQMQSKPSSNLSIRACNWKDIQEESQKSVITASCTDRSRFARILSQLGVGGLHISSVPHRKKCRGIKSCTFPKLHATDDICDSNLDSLHKLQSSMKSLSKKKRGSPHITLLDRPSDIPVSSNNRPYSVSHFIPYSSLTRIKRCATKTSNSQKSSKCTQPVFTNCCIRQLDPKSASSKQCIHSFCGFRSRILSSVSSPGSTRPDIDTLQFGSRPTTFVPCMEEQYELHPDDLRTNFKLKNSSKKSREQASSHSIFSKLKKANIQSRRNCIFPISRSAILACTRSTRSRAVTCKSKSQKRRIFGVRKPVLLEKGFHTPSYSVKQHSSNSDISYRKNTPSLLPDQYIPQKNIPRWKARRKYTLSSFRYLPDLPSRYSTENLANLYHFDRKSVHRLYESSDSTDDDYRYGNYYQSRQMVDYPYRDPYFSDENLYYCPSYMFPYPSAPISGGSVHRPPPLMFSPTSPCLPHSQPIYPMPCSPPSNPSLPRTQYQQPHHYSQPFVQPYYSRVGSYPYHVDAHTPYSARASTESVSSSQFQSGLPNWRPPCCKPSFCELESGILHVRNPRRLRKYVGDSFGYQKIPKRFSRKRHMNRDKNTSFNESRSFSTPPCPAESYSPVSFYEFSPFARRLQRSNSSRYPRYLCTQKKSDLIYGSNCCSQVPVCSHGAIHPNNRYFHQKDHENNKMNYSCHRNQISPTCDSFISNQRLLKPKYAMSRKARNKLSSNCSFASSSSDYNIDSPTSSYIDYQYPRNYLSKYNSLDGFKKSRIQNRIPPNNIIHNKYSTKRASCGLLNSYSSPYKKHISLYDSDSVPSISHRKITDLRSQVCSSATDVHRNSRHKSDKINHFDDKIKLELQKIGIKQLLKACRPAKCCKQIILNQSSMEELPYAASLASLPLDRADLRVIKQSVAMSSKRKDFNYSASEIRRKLMYYANILTDDFNLQKPKVKLQYEVRYIFYKLDDIKRVQDVIKMRYNKKSKFKFIQIFNPIFERRLYRSRLTNHPNSIIHCVLNIVPIKNGRSSKPDTVFLYYKFRKKNSKKVSILVRMSRYEFQHLRHVLRKRSEKSETSVTKYCLMNNVSVWHNVITQYSKMPLKVRGIPIENENFSFKPQAVANQDDRKYIVRLFKMLQTELDISYFSFDLNLFEKIANLKIVCRLYSEKKTTISALFIETSIGIMYDKIQEGMKTCIRAYQVLDNMKFNKNEIEIQNLIQGIAKEMKNLNEGKNYIIIFSFVDNFEINACADRINRNNFSTELITYIPSIERDINKIDGDNKRITIEISINVTNNQILNGIVLIEKLAGNRLFVSSGNTKMGEVYDPTWYITMEIETANTKCIPYKRNKYSLHITNTYKLLLKDEKEFRNNVIEKLFKISIRVLEKLCFSKTEINMQINFYSTLDGVIKNFMGKSALKITSAMTLIGKISDENEKDIPAFHGCRKNLLEAVLRTFIIKKIYLRIGLKELLSEHHKWKYRSPSYSGNHIIFSSSFPDEKFLTRISIIDKVIYFSCNLYDQKNSLKEICCQEENKMWIYSEQVKPMVSTPEVGSTMGILDICNITQLIMIDFSFERKTRVSSGIYTENKFPKYDSKSGKYEFQMNFKIIKLYEYQAYNSIRRGLKCQPNIRKLLTMTEMYQKKPLKAVAHTNKNSRMEANNFEEIDIRKYSLDQHRNQKLGARTYKNSIMREYCKSKFGDIIIKGPSSYYTVCQKHLIVKNNNGDTTNFTGKLKTNEEKTCNHEKYNGTDSQRQETKVTTILPDCGTTGSIVQRSGDSLESLLDDCLENGKLMNHGDNRRHERRKLINYQMVEDTLMECLNLTRHPNSLQRMSHTILRYFTYTVFNQIKKNYNKHMSKKQKRNNCKNNQDTTILYFNSKHFPAFSLGSIFCDPKEIETNPKSKEGKSKSSDDVTSSSQEHQEMNSVLSLNDSNIEKKVSSQDAFLCNLPNAPPFILKMNKTAFGTELMNIGGVKTTKDDYNEHSSMPTSIIDSLEIGRMSSISSLLSRNYKHQGYYEMSKHNLFIENTCPAFSNQDFRVFVGKSISFIEKNRNLSLCKSRGCFMSSPTVCMTGLSGFSINPFTMDERDSRRVYQNSLCRPSEDILSDETSHHYQSKIPRMLHPGKYKVHSKMKNGQVSPGTKGYTVSKSQACSSKVCNDQCPAEKLDIRFNQNAKIGMSTNRPGTTNNCASANTRTEKQPLGIKNVTIQEPVSKPFMGDCVKGIKSDPGCYCGNDLVEETPCPVRLKETFEYVEDNITKEPDEENEDMCYCPSAEQPLLMKKSDIECDCANRNRCETETLVEPPVEKPNVFWALTKVSLLKDGTKNFEIIDVSPVPPGYYLMPEVNNLILVGPQPKPVKAAPNKNCSCK